MAMNWTDHGLTVHLYEVKSGDGERFRKISVELFGELLDLTTAESSTAELKDMLKSCDWVQLRTKALKSEVVGRLERAALSEIGEVNELSEGGISFLFGSSTDEGPVTVGAIEVPVEAIVRFADAGFGTDKII